MTTNSFLNSLALVTAATAAVLGLLHVLLENMQQHWIFSISILAVFVLLSIGLFFAGKSSARSSNKMAFNGLISGSTFGKMFLAVGLLFVYQESAKPTNQWFVALFLLIYVIFTVYEVWFLTRIAREK
ncbi:MAG: hypothetical protein RIR11_2010 [Bacteroidota bacterium]|jgi:hypothetical protein